MTVTNHENYKKRPPDRVKIPGGVWVTKYALTKGIFFYADAGYVQNSRWDSEKHEWVVEDRAPYVEVKYLRNGIRMGSFSTDLYHGKDFHLTEEAARKRAADMVAAKRKSVEKMLSKLDSVSSVLTKF